MGEELDLTDQEKIEIREIIEKDRRWKWLATTLRNTMAWVAVVALGITVGWEWSVKIIKAGVSQ